jgi:hypothetical protein
MSQDITEILIIGVISTVTIIGGILIPPAIIKVSVDKETAFTYQYERLQYTLLAVLSSTHDGRTVYEIIGNSAAGIPEDLEFLKKDLNELGLKCYTIQVKDNDMLTTLSENGSCDKKYTFTTVITLPRDPDSRAKLLRIDAG